MIALKFSNCDIGWFTVDTEDIAYMWTYLIEKQMSCNRLTSKFRGVRQYIFDGGTDSWMDKMMLYSS
jgi:hypothetical protein